MGLSLAEVKRINKDKGRYFFSKDTIRFFGSRVHNKELVKGKYFITSEDNYDKTKREYRIRQFNEKTGAVNTIASEKSAVDFLIFKSLEEAKEYLKGI